MQMNFYVDLVCEAGWCSEEMDKKEAGSFSEAC